MIHLIKAANFNIFLLKNQLEYNSYSLIYLQIKNTLDCRLHILNLKVDQSYKKMLNQDQEWVESSNKVYVILWYCLHSTFHNYLLLFNNSPNLYNLQYSLAYILSIFYINCVWLFTSLYKIKDSTFENTSFYHLWYRKSRS